MKRTLPALLAIAATLTVNLVSPAPASAADIECRYVVAPNPPPPRLPPDEPVRFGPDGAVADFELRQPRWSVVGVRPHGKLDYHLRVFNCPDGRTVGRSRAGTSLVDFVALDGNRPWQVPASGERKVLYADIYRNQVSPSGVVTVGYATGGPPLTPGTSQSLLMRDAPVLVRDVYVAPGASTRIMLQVARGDGDLFLVDSGAVQTGWARSRDQAIARSISAGGTSEWISISVPFGVLGRTFGIVVVNNADDGSYRLTRY